MVSLTVAFAMMLVGTDAFDTALQVEPSGRFAPLMRSRSPQTERVSAETIGAKEPLMRSRARKRTEDSPSAASVVADERTTNSAARGVHARIASDGTLSVSFGHDGKPYHYDQLVPHSVYAHDAKVYLGEQLHKAEITEIRTYKLRDHGKWVSATLHPDGTVQGLFEDAGRVMEITPTDQLKDASLLQGFSSSYPPHVVRWVARPNLEKPGIVQDIRPTTPGIATDDAGGNHVPQTGEVAVHEYETSEMVHSGVWGGQSWAGSSTCYTGDTQMNEFKVGFAADYKAREITGDANAVRTKLESIIADASFVYEKQMNVKLTLDHLVVSNSTNDWMGGCPAEGDIPSTKLGIMKKAVQDKTFPTKASNQMWTGCGNAYGTVGLAYVGTICRGSYATGMNKIHTGSPWLTFAHELGHNFAGAHSFEDGQGKTGGIMDYGNGKLGGHYQFNSKYRKDAVCQKINQTVNKCDGNFVALGPTPTPPTPACKAKPTESKWSDKTCNKKCNKKCKPTCQKGTKCNKKCTKKYKKCKICKKKCTPGCCISR